MKPFTICRLPKPLSMVVVMATMLPSLSTIDTWLVEGSDSESSSPRGSAPAGLPATGTPIVLSILMSVERCFR